MRSPLGAGGGTRTPDLLITNQLLYRLSHTSNLFEHKRVTNDVDYNTFTFICQEEF